MKAKFSSPFEFVQKSIRRAVAGNPAIVAAIRAHADADHVAESIGFDQARFTAQGAVEIPVTFFKGGTFRTEDRGIIRLSFDESFSRILFAEFFLLRIRESRLVFDEFFQGEFPRFSKSA